MLYSTAEMATKYAGADKRKSPGSGKVRGYHLANYFYRIFLTQTKITYFICGVNGITTRQHVIYGYCANNHSDPFNGPKR